jgi:hypothetical protein
MENTAITHVVHNGYVDECRRTIRDGVSATVVSAFLKAALLCGAIDGYVIMTNGITVAEQAGVRLLRR